MTADIGPVVKAVEQAVITRLNVTRPMRRIFGDEVADALEVILVQEAHVAAPEVAKAAMDAARPIIDAEAYARGWADATEVVEFQGQKVYRHQVMEMLPPNWADELTDIDDRSK